MYAVSSSRHACAVPIAITVIGFAAVVLAQPVPSFERLGDLPGHNYHSRVFGLSADGNVAVGLSSSANSATEAFKWTSAEGMIGLGDLSGGDFFSNARAATANGSVIAGNGTGATGAEVAIWTSSGIRALVDNQGVIDGGNARAISSDGSVVVGRGFDDQTADPGQAFRWTSQTGIVGLGDLQGGTFDSVATAVSGDGNLVAGYGDGNNGTEAFRWTEAEGLVGLGDLPGGRTESQAWGVSGDGNVIVGYGYSTPVAGEQEALRWTSDGGMTGLGWLPFGGWNSNAYDVSYDGSVIVGQASLPSGSRAFVWDATNGMRDIKAVLEEDFGFNLLGWTLSEARAVSDDGTVIVGNAQSPEGNTEAWIARVPRGPIIEGDANFDGFVGADDLVVLIDNWNDWVTPRDRSHGDITGDGYVGADDLSRLIRNWNAGVLPTSAAAVPEPASAGVTILLALMLQTRCRRRR